MTHAERDHHRPNPKVSVRIVRRGAIFALMLAVLPAGAGPGIPWFDLELLPDPVRAPLIRYQRFACGAVGTADLPLPDDVRLVFVSCHGGPYACPADNDGLGEYERQFTCPAEPTARQIATMHLVSRHSLSRLQMFYRLTLGSAFIELPANNGAQATFVESIKDGGDFSWSPKRLHLAISATREPFRGTGFASQIRITLSINPPSEPRPDFGCREFYPRSPYGRKVGRRRSTDCLP